jgi:hypothetical protein
MTDLIKNISYDNWRDIVDNLSIDDLISMYKTGSYNYREFLDSPVTIQYLLNKYHINTIKPGTFRNFITVYDAYYASDRCEHKHRLEFCLKNAVTKGQLYWVIYYLNKYPNLVKKAFEIAAYHDQLEIGKYILENYPRTDVFIKDIVKVNNINFLDMWWSQHPPQKTDILTLFLIRNINSEMADFLINYLDTHYPGWYGSSYSVLRVNHLLANLMRNGYYNEASQYFDERFSDSLVGYVWGLANVLSFGEFKEYIEDMVRLNTPDEMTYFFKHLLSRREYLGSEITKWILETYLTLQ